MIKCIVVCLMLNEAMVRASVVGRAKRFLTPTTYPIPTTFMVPTTMGKDNDQMLGSLIANSRPIDCPVKRDTRAKRVYLDSSMMRELYLRNVGIWNSRFVAETQLEAKENFVDILEFRNHTQKNSSERKTSVKGHIKELSNRETTFHKQINDSNPWLNKGFIQYLGNRTSRVNRILKHIFSSPRVARTRRSSDGSETTVHYCNPRGNLTADGHMHMCSTCVMTTVLPVDRFPRYINEAGCDSTDCNCFTINDISHGKCQPRHYYVKILKRVANGCRLMIKNGQQIITDNWELYDQPVQVGCECVLDKRSPFARYIAG